MRWQSWVVILVGVAVAFLIERDKGRRDRSDSALIAEILRKAEYDYPYIVFGEDGPIVLWCYEHEARQVAGGEHDPYCSVAASDRLRHTPCRMISRLVNEPPDDDEPDDD